MTLDGNTLKGFVSCTKNIAGMADQDAQLKRQTEDFFGWIHEQISFDSAYVQYFTCYIAIKLWGLGFFGVFF